MPQSSGYSSIGTSGLERYGGYVTEEEFIPGLSGRRAIRTFKEMRENDPAIGAFMFVIDNLIRGVEWRMEPFSEEQRDVETSEFVNECRNDMSMSWNDVISESLSMLEYGWAYHEIIYKRREGPNEDGRYNSRFNDGKVGWRKLPLRAQETLDRWKFNDEDDGIDAMIQRAPPDYKDREIPIKRGLLFRTTVRKNNPEGRSVFRNAYRPWYYKKRIEEIEGVGIERDLAGLPMAYVDPEIMKDNASDDDKKLYKAIKDIVTQVRRDKVEGVVFPRLYDDQGHELYSFELLSSGGSRQFDIPATLERKSREILMTVAADFILLGHEKVGSYALSSDKTNLFGVAINTFLDIIQEVFNRYAIPRLLAVNGMDVQRPPKLEHGDIEKPDISVVGAFLAQMSGIGMQVFPDTRNEEWARELAGMPELTEEEKKEQEEMKELKSEQRRMQMEQPPAPPGPGGVQPGPRTRGNGREERKGSIRTRSRDRGSGGRSGGQGGQPDEGRTTPS